MPFAAELLTDYRGPESLSQSLRALSDSLGGSPDLLFVFASPHFESEMIHWPNRLTSETGTENVFGCNADSIVCNELEVEDQPAVALWGARLPGVEVHACHLEYQSLQDDSAFVGWTDEMTGAWDDGNLLAMADPFSFPMDVFLNRMNEDRAGVPAAGGMISAASAPGESVLIMGGQVHRSGALIVLITGHLRIDHLVSQGCRPIGDPLVITRAENNQVLQLAGRPALEVVQEIFARLPTRDQRLVNQGLHVGRVIDEYQDSFQPGDFLIRNVVGADPESGSIVIADYARSGQTIQFHVRDQETAGAELRSMLRSLDSQQPGGSRGGLLFNCNGRGRHLFDEPNHDAGLIQKELGGLPLAGFFAAGEIGPVGGQNFLHGFTASLAIFEAPG